MASLNFYLEHRKNLEGMIERKDLPVLLYFSYEGKRFQYYTGEKCDLNQWDKEKQRLYGNASNAEQVNAYLDFLAAEVWQLYRSARASGRKPSNEYFRSSLRVSGRTGGMGFFDALLEFIEEHSEEWSVTTFLKVKTFYNHLRRFSRVNGSDISFERINKVFYDDCIRYFADHRGHSNTTIHKNLMILKWFLNWATDKGYNRNMFFRLYQFPWETRFRLDPAETALTREELFTLLAHKYSDDRLELARDVFCLMCFTGLKYSELAYLEKNSVSGSYLMVNNPDRYRSRGVPLNKYARSIILKYFQADRRNNRDFPGYSNVTMNRYVKAAVREAGIRGFIEIRYCSGKLRHKRNIPKWQAISTKTAATTFIMNALELEIPVNLLMDFTGLSTTFTRKKYERMYSQWKTVQMKKFDRIIMPKQISADIRGRYDP